MEPVTPMSQMDHEAKNPMCVHLVRSCPRKRSLERACRAVAFVPTNLMCSKWRC
jgi:hypothetical protein